MPDTVEELKKFIPKRDMVGKKFGRLTVVEPIGRTNNGTIVYKCRCECGNTHHASTNSLRQYVIKSCGCLNRERFDSKPFKTHGMAGTRIYKTWQGMLARCNKPTSTSYDRYGGRGIKVCKRWHKFVNFYSDMKEGYNDTLTIDRVNPNGNYCKSNCRWATFQEQAENKRNTIFLTIDGVTKTLMDWSRISGVSSRLIAFRIRDLGWNDIKMAVYKPSVRKISSHAA